MKISNQERQILNEIFKAANGLYLFTLHRELNLSPRDLFKAIENLKVNGLVEITEDRASITKKGIGFSVQTTPKTKGFENNDIFIKEEYLGRKININEFYIPQNYEK